MIERGFPISLLYSNIICDMYTYPSRVREYIIDYSLMEELGRITCILYNPLLCTHSYFFGRMTCIGRYEPVLMRESNLHLSIVCQDIPIRQGGPQNASYSHKM